MSRPGPAIAAVMLATMIAGVAPARADDLELRPRQDVPLLIGGGLLFVLSETLLKDALAPDACRWCGTNALDRSIRDALRWDDPSTPASISKWTGFVAAPVVMLGGLGAAALLDDHRDQAWRDAVIVLESAVLAADVTNLAKGAFGRERPFVHYLDAADKPRTASPQENNLSFFSGHSSFTMSLAVSAGTVASLRGYRAAPAVWGAGLGLALTTGYLRIAADRHWTTDVVTGWAVGAAVGFAVPYYLHRRSTTAAPHDVSASLGPRAVALSFRW